MRPDTTIFLFLITMLSGCRHDPQTIAHNNDTSAVVNQIKYAKGLEIYEYEEYTVMKVTHPWPEAKDSYNYVLHKKGATIPDSLKNYTAIQIPLQSVVVTSTTHIPSLEMLGVENTLKGFPNTDYISSERTRDLIGAGKVKEAGVNENLNTEVIIDLAPDALVGFSISSSNKALSQLEKSGVKVIYNGDWTEQNPLGKAEWIKFFGALYDKSDAAQKLFTQIENDYNQAKAIAAKAVTKPTILGGALYQDQWYMPQGGSWAAKFLNDAQGNYLWKDARGTGSLNLSFETVLDKAQDADYWIGPGQFTSLEEMVTANPHYAELKAFKNKEIYSFSTKKGKTGGVIYYELAPNRPDLVLKDLISILHPELLPGYKLHFFEKLK